MPSVNNHLNQLCHEIVLFCAGVRLALRRLSRGHNCSLDLSPDGLDKSVLKVHFDTRITAHQGPNLKTIYGEVRRARVSPFAGLEEGLAEEPAPAGS
jgi:hypothetical protein